MNYYNSSQVKYMNINDEKQQQQAREYMDYIYQDIRSYKSAMYKGDYNKASSEAEQIAEKSLKSLGTKKGNLSVN